MEVHLKNMERRSVMIAGTPNVDKQLLVEKIWLHYFNDVLYRDGIITAEDYHKMVHRINNRCKAKA